MAASSRRAAAGEAGNDHIRIAFIGVDARGVDSDVVAALERGIERALGESSVMVVRVPRSQRPRDSIGEPCLTEKCLSELAASASATHVLGGILNEGEQAGPMLYDGRLYVWRAAPFGLASSTQFQCERCIRRALESEGELKAMELVGQLVDIVRQENSQPLSGSPTARTPSDNDHSAWRLPATFALLGAGSAFLAAGTAMVVLGDRSLCSDAPPERCPDVRRLGPPGWIGVSLGAGFVTAALIMVFTAEHQASIGGNQRFTFGVGPTSAGIFGTF